MNCKYNIYCNLRGNINMSENKKSPIDQYIDQYKEARSDLINKINSYRQKKGLNSPLLAYAEEILRLTQLQRSSIFNKTEKCPGNIALEDLTQSLLIASKALEISHNIFADYNPYQLIHENLTYIERLKKYDTKNSQIKKIGGLLLGITGLLMIFASATLAVMTYGLATPLSIAGVNLGVSCIAAGTTAGAAATVSGLGLFRDRKPHAQKIIESVQGINNEIQRHKEKVKTTLSGDL